MSNTILKQVVLLCALSFTVLSAHALQGDTLIPTQSGNKAIKDIKVGDLVLSKDETTNQIGYQSVTHHHNEEYSQTVYLNVVDELGNSQTIITNKTHPFFTQTTNPIPSSEGYVYQGGIDGADWVDASNLKVGDKLLSQDGKWQTVQSVKVTNQPLTAYHLTVNNSHTHFVTTNGKYGVWVHNNGKTKTETRYNNPQKHKEDLARQAGIPRDIANNPASVWGKSAEQIKQSFEMDGATVIRKPTKAGTSGNGQVYEVKGSASGIKEFEYHAGGGVHTPKGVFYYKIVKNDGSEIRIIDPNQGFKPGTIAKHQSYLNPNGQTLKYEGGKWVVVK